ncbi:hypothetical protein E8E14_010684 [Neopestalotiopsis sp. 37M]|nr:hypothetical protein E8E14_010684 [Neopestalotiopsis sp. 37M]
MAFEYPEVDSEGSHSKTSLETAPFLANEELSTSKQSAIRRVCSLRNFVIVIPWLLVAGLSVALARSSKSSFLRSVKQGLDEYSPAASAIEYHDVLFYRGFGDGSQGQSAYQGWPNDYNDRLWDEMYNNGFNTRVEASAHAQFLNKTMRYPVAGYEDDYVVGLDVFHQLHCLNRLRKAFYPKRYNSSMINPDGTVSWMKWMHIDHCIESLRQSLTCSSDVTANGFDWREDVKYMMPRINTVHSCRNFDKIKKWAFDRYVPLNNLQSNVEASGLVDWSKTYPNPEDPKNLEQHPEFQYTVDDM